MKGVKVKCPNCGVLISKKMMKRHKILCDALENLKQSNCENTLGAQAK
jgi:hypothetical protein